MKTDTHTQEKEIRQFVKEWQTIFKRQRMGRGYTLYRSPDGWGKPFGLQWESRKMRAIYLNDKYSSITKDNLSMKGPWRAENEAALLYAELGDMIDKNEMERGAA
jgi:hypothetical protein